MTDDIEKLMNAHLEGIGRELRDLKEQQRAGFTDLRSQIAARDTKTDAEMLTLSNRVRDLEGSVNAWRAQIRLWLILLTFGMPLLLFAASHYMNK